MPFKRLHSNGLEMLISLESTQREWWGAAQVWIEQTPDIIGTENHIRHGKGASR
jgi:hypothetical protein